MMGLFLRNEPMVFVNIIAASFSLIVFVPPARFELKSIVQKSCALKKYHQRRNLTDIPYFYFTPLRKRTVALKISSAASEMT